MNCKRLIRRKNILIDDLSFKVSDLVVAKISKWTYFSNITLQINIMLGVNQYQITTKYYKCDPSSFSFKDFMKCKYCDVTFSNADIHRKHNNKCDKCYITLKKKNKRMNICGIFIQNNNENYPQCLVVCSIPLSVVASYSPSRRTHQSRDISSGLILLWKKKIIGLHWLYLQLFFFSLKYLKKIYILIISMG